MYRTLCAMATAAPAAAMIAAHYIPWRKAIGRELHRLEAYAIGTVAIIGSAGSILTMAEDANIELRPRQSAGVMFAAAVGAGCATVAAWTLDHLLERHHRRLDRELRNAKKRHI